MERVVNYTWENLAFQVPAKDSDGRKIKKTLIHKMSGTALGGRVLAIMGPSGAGKTTLMSAITGKLHGTEKNLEGCCFLNNAIFTDRYRAVVSFVAQDDIVMAMDTPYEATYFACRVRLGLGPRESEVLVNEVINRLHLVECQDTVLGIPGLVKGVSGGERKRANVATALVANPCVIVLDEPTTGLDSVNALRVGQMLQDLAKKEKRTVIATVHSPSSELVETFDDLLLLSEGHVVYHGPREEATAYFASIGHQVPPRTNPCEYFMELLQLPKEELEVLWRAWELYLTTPAASTNPCLLKVSGPITERDPYLEDHLKKKGSSWIVQLVELTKRSYRMYPRHPSAVFVRLVQTLFVGILMALFYFRITLDQNGVKDRLGVLHMVLINGMFSSAMYGAAAYPPERAVYLQEQSTDSYNALTYVLAKFIAETAFQVAFPTAFALITYFTIGFYASFSAFMVHWFLLVQLALTAYAFGLAFATFFKSINTTYALLPVVFLPLIIVTGLYANTERLHPYWSWLIVISFPRHAYLGVVINEFSRLEKICDPPDLHCRYPDGQSVIEFFNFDSWSWWKSIVVLLAYQAVLIIITFVSLLIQGKRSRGRLVFRKNLDSRSDPAQTAACAGETEEGK